MVGLCHSVMPSCFLQSPWPSGLRTSPFISLDQRESTYHHLCQILTFQPMAPAAVMHPRPIHQMHPAWLYQGSSKPKKKAFPRINSRDVRCHVQMRSGSFGGLVWQQYQWCWQGLVQYLPEWSSRPVLLHGFAHQSRRDTEPSHLFTSPPGDSVCYYVSFNELPFSLN